MFENVDQKKQEQGSEGMQLKQSAEQPKDYTKQNTIASEVAKQQSENPETIIDIDDNETSINRKNILLIVGVLLIVLLILTGVGFFVVRAFSEEAVETGVIKTNTTATNSAVNTNTEVQGVIEVNTNTTANTNTNTNLNTGVDTNTNTTKVCVYSDLTEVVVNPEADSDKDGLLDGLEHSYGTSILNPDTDGDTYLDGDEVKNGYSPCGLGKL